MVNIGDNIRTARKRKGFTQEELAHQIGVTSQAVSRWESGSGMPDISMIVPIAQVASFEQGVEGMKVVLCSNLQNMVRAMNKEIMYAVQDMSWSDTPENAIEFATWGLHVIAQFCEKKELIPYCRGFYRDIYKYMLHADLRKDDYELAQRHWQELCEGMQMHYQYYQDVLCDEALVGQFPERQLHYMRAYTEEFISDKQNAIKERLREWHGEDKFANFKNVIQ